MKQLIVEQKITAFANQYSIFAVDSTGAKGELLAFAHQKRLALKEKIEFFSDIERTDRIFSVQAEKTLDVHGKYYVKDALDTPIGAMKKVFTSSLLRSTWEIIDNDTQERLLLVQESSQKKAIFRRIWQIIPYIGDLPFILKYHFDFLASDGTTLVATYLKTTLLYDHYRLDIINDVSGKLDWRVIAAQCVMLDALQGR